MILRILNAVVFCGLAVPPLVMLRRRHDRATAWLAGAFGCLGLATALGLVLPSDESASLTTWQQWWAKVFVLLPIVLYPYCLLRFAASFDVRTQLTRIATALTAVVAIGLLAFPGFPSPETSTPWRFTAWVVAFVVQWVGLSIFAAWRLWQAGREEPTVTRRRMQLLSLAATTLSLVILLSVGTQSSNDPWVQGLSTTMSFGAAALMMLGVAPPSWLRLLWRRVEQAGIYDLQLALIKAESGADVTAVVLPMVTKLLGGGAAAFVDEGDKIVASCGTGQEVAALRTTLDGASTEALPAERSTVPRTTLRSGALVALAGSYAPLFGSDELRLLDSISLMVDLALRRIASQEELSRAHQQAVEASRLKSEFVANMSHEIRTPMNGVIGMTDLLLHTDQTGEQQEYTQTIRTSADALLNVINDILDFSKIEAGKLDLNENDFDMRAAVEEVTALLASGAHSKGIELAMAVDDSIPASVRGDASRLRQVLLNIAGNAVKFTETGEVVIRVGAELGESNKLVAKFEVQDTGPGIAPETVGRLFESFSQADTSSTRRHGGTGLGLAISKRLVEMMGGKIGVISTVGEGSTFWFTVNLAQASREWVSPLHDLDEIAGRSVLIVDDNATNRIILDRMTRSWGLDPVAVAGADEAQEVMRLRHEQGQPFDVALLDYHMPGLDGAQLARLMRNDRHYRSTARVLLTSVGDRGGLSDGEIDCFLTKPVRPAALLDCIARVLTTERLTAHDTSPDTDELVTTSPTSARRVLLAEDNVVNQQVALRMLESLGCEVDIVDNGAKALDAATKETYDLIFMDCQMPTMDGYEATSALRQREGAARHTPVIALTASAMAGDAERCLATGMDDYLAKPVRREDFASTLARWFTPDEKKASTTGSVIDLTILPSSTGDQDEGAALLELFMRTTNTQIRSMREAQTSGDLAMLGKLCHTVRGSALSFGAQGLVMACESLEIKTARPDDDRPIGPYVEAISEEFELIRKFVSTSASTS